MDPFIDAGFEERITYFRNCLTYTSIVFIIVIIVAVFLLIKFYLASQQRNIKQISSIFALVSFHTTM